MKYLHEPTESSHSGESDEQSQDDGLVRRLDGGDRHADDLDLQALGVLPRLGNCSVLQLGFELRPLASCHFHDRSGRIRVSMDLEHQRDPFSVRDHFHSSSR